MRRATRSSEYYIENHLYSSLKTIYKNNTMETPEKTTAEKHYANVRKAQKEYYRRKNPNPKPRGRPRKDVPAPAPALTNPDLVGASSV
jgi:hypothetical protein